MDRFGRKSCQANPRAQEGTEENKVSLKRKAHVILHKG